MDMKEMLQLAGVELFEVVEFPPMPEAGADALLAIDGVIKQLEAAKRGLGIANRLRDPVARKKHKGAVLGNLNRIRNRLAQIEKLAMEVGDDPYGQNIPQGNEGQAQ